MRVHVVTRAVVAGVEGVGEVTDRVVAAGGERGLAGLSWPSKKRWSVRTSSGKIVALGLCGSALSEPVATSCRV
jgi:hypothetical protein